MLYKHIKTILIIAEFTKHPFMKYSHLKLTFINLKWNNINKKGLC